MQPRHQEQSWRLTSANLSSTIGSQPRPTRKGPVAASTNVGERLIEPVLALPEAPVNFEDLSFVDHPPTAATLLLLADEPVSEDEDF